MAPGESARYYDYFGNLLYCLTGYSREQVDGLEGADAHESVMLISKRQGIKRAVQIVAMLRIQLPVEQQVAERLARHTNAIGGGFKKGDVGRSSLQHRDEAQQSHRVNMPNPVILRSRQSSRGRRRNA